MIGDDVPRFRRRSHHWVITSIENAWSKLQCMIYGHLYRPHYTQQSGKVRYECECCGEKTKWMSKTEHQWFNLRECPTWGDRGSDSQNYLFIGPPEKPKITRRSGKKRRKTS